MSISTNNWDNSTEILNLGGWDGNEEWVKETINLNEYAGESVEIAFHSNDNGNWASGVALDDIKLGMTPSWISSSSEGTIQFQGVETFNFSLSTSGLSDGEYNATVVIEDIYQSLSDTLLVNLTVDGALVRTRMLFQRNLFCIKTIQTLSIHPQISNFLFLAQKKFIWLYMTYWVMWLERWSMKI